MLHLYVKTIVHIRVTEVFNLIGSGLVLSAHTYTECMYGIPVTVILRCISYQGRGPCTNHSLVAVAQ